MFAEPSSTRRARYLGAILLVAAATGCSDEGSTGPATDSVALLEETRVQGAPSLSTIHNSAPTLATCGTGASYTLWAGRTFPGSIRIENDAENLYVTYRVNPDREEWFITDTRLMIVRSVHSIPTDERRLPNPWEFPHGSVHEPATKSYTYVIPLAEYSIQPGEKLIVAAMAGLVHPVTTDWSGSWEWLVGWGLGNISGRTLDDVSNYTVGACADASPPPAPSSTAAITITFDDGWESTYTRAFPILQEFGLAGNVAVNPVPVDGLWTGYMKIEQLRELHAAGWSIVAHGMTHRALPGLSDAELQYELDGTKAWIQQNGFRGSHVFIVPFHDWGERERQAMVGRYSAVRGYTANQFSTLHMVSFPVTGDNAFALTGFEPEFAPFTTAAGRNLTREYLEKAVADGEFIDIFFHRIEEADVAAFREMIRIIAEFEPHVVTYTEAIPG